MGQLTFQATLGGAVNLVGPNTASTTSLTLPSSDGTSGQSLQTNGSGVLSFASTSLTSGVTGTLPIANGGTGTTSTTFANLTTNVTGTLPIANGGTNSTATATAGGVGYGTGTAHAYTSAGTAGQVLTSAGASAPTWVTPAGGGSMILLQTVTGSGVDAIDVEGFFTSTYEFYKLYVEVTQSSASAVAFRLFINGTLNTSAGNYGTSSQYSSPGSALINSNNEGSTILINIAGKNTKFEFTFLDPSNVNHRNAIHFIASASSDGPGQAERGWGNCIATGSAGQRAITGIRIFQPTATYTARLYGIKETS
jgi:hypothetical protein